MTMLFESALSPEADGLWQWSAAALPLDRRLKRVVKLLLGREQSIRWGSLRRTRPLSRNYGLERGTPVDRVYIEQFLRMHAADIRGHVLEVRDSSYTRAIGGDRVTASDIVDIDPANPWATILADLGAEETLPAETFDCIILTQTLQYVARPHVATANLGRALAPGGTLLVTAPSTSQVDPHAAGTDLWRFTPEGLANLIHGSGDLEEITAVGYGNVLASVAFLLGLVGEDLRASELEDHDAQYPLVACARARKRR